MNHILMLRQFAPGLEQKDFYAMAEETLGCLEIYRAEWQESLLATDGSRLVCHFIAPDSESLRQISRGDASRDKKIWPATVHPGKHEGFASVIVERSFAGPASMDELQSREDAASPCLELHRVHFVRSLFSQDRQRMVCLYQAPDAESVRLAQEQAGMPCDAVWACKHYTPDNMFS